MDKEERGIEEKKQRKEEGEEERGREEAQISPENHKCCLKIPKFAACPDLK